MEYRTKNIRRICVTGATGLLGQHVARLFKEESNCDLYLSGRSKTCELFTRDSDARPFSYIPAEITNRAEVRALIKEVRPEVIINCAGFVDVDAAESSRELAWRTNVSAVEYLVESARKVDARIIHFSSDYIFDGLRVPYAENDRPHPLNYYGRTKLASENVLRTSAVDYTIFRTCSLYGAASDSNVNLAMGVAETLLRQEQIVVPTDLLCSPTLVDDVALAALRATERNRSGLYNVAGPQLMSRFDFAIAVARAFQLDESLVVPTTLGESLSKRAEKSTAERPLQSSFVTLKAQTDLGIRFSNVAEGLQVVARGLQEILELSSSHLYE